MVHQSCRDALRDCALSSPRLAADSVTRRLCGVTESWGFCREKKQAFALIGRRAEEWVSLCVSLHVQAHEITPRHFCTLTHLPSSSAGQSWFIFLLSSQCLVLHLYTPHLVPHCFSLRLPLVLAAAICVSFPAAAMKHLPFTIWIQQKAAPLTGRSIHVSCLHQRTHSRVWHMQPFIVTQWRIMSTS